MINILSNLLNTFKSKTEPTNINNNEPKRILIYAKTIPVISTNTEGRQKLIKELIKNNNDLKLSDDLYQELLLCDCDIKEPEFKSKSKILEVFVNIEKNNNIYPYTLGYISNEYNELFDAELHNNTYYSTTLYVTKVDNLYNLEINIKFYKDNKKWLIYKYYGEKMDMHL